MNTNPPSDSQPLLEASSQPKPRIAAKARPSQEERAAVGPISADWTLEVAASFGLTGPLANAVAEKISKALASALANRITRPKLTKLVRTAVKEAIR
jgi:hypothetical protein